MEVKKLTGEACKKTRTLWEEVFSEDTKQFTDYYFENKAPQNIAYVIGEEPFHAMMFRTPYTLKLWEQKREISYLVGVATKKEFRHKGYMTALLIKAFQEMYREKNPFTFLMPANPAIYEPFDFTYVYSRPIWKLKNETATATWLESLMQENKDSFPKRSENKEFLLKVAEHISEMDNKSLQQQNGIQQLAEKMRQEDYIFTSIQSIAAKKGEEGLSSIFQKLSDFANQWLRERYQIYAYRDVAYYQMQWKELLAQNGDIFLLLKEEQIVGFFLYAREEDEIAIQEVMEQEEGLFPFLKEEEEKEPIIMARIIHFEEMMKLVRSPKNRTILVEIEDDLIAENEGLYRVEMTPKGSTVTRLKESRTPEISLNIGQLTPYLLKEVFLNEIV